MCSHFSPFPDRSGNPYNQVGKTRLIKEFWLSKEEKKATKFVIRDLIHRVRNLKIMKRSIRQLEGSSINEALTLSQDHEWIRIHERENELKSFEH